MERAGETAYSDPGGFDKSMAGQGCTRARCEGGAEGVRTSMCVRVCCTHNLYTRGSMMQQARRRSKTMPNEKGAEPGAERGHQKCTEGTGRPLCTVSSLGVCASMSVQVRVCVPALASAHVRSCV